MPGTQDSRNPDVARINRIDAVPRILDAVVAMTGMRFAAVARVTELTWTACAVRDDLGFGLAPADQLVLETTICNEIRQHGQPVVFGHASTHPQFCTHHTPKQYAIESYLSVPIIRADGSFFGTLCAIDSRPTDLDDPAILSRVQLLAELIGIQLDIEADLETSRRRLSESQASQTLRERVLADAEREIRDLFQPIITGLYLLRTSTTLDDDNANTVADMRECCEEIQRRLRGKLDDVYGQIESSPVAGNHP